MKIKSYAKSPRWAKFPSFLRELCFRLNLKLDIDVDKGFIRETTYFTVEGTENELLIFEKIFNEAIKDYEI